MKKIISCVAVVALLFMAGALAQQPSGGESTATEKASVFDLEIKKREVGGQYNAAKESLAHIMQQLTGTSLARDERTRLEGDEAKLRPQIKSLSEQLELINQRLADAPRGDAKLPPGQKAGIRSHVTASLLLIQADWSTVQDAQQIKTEILAALADTNVPKELLDNLPASGPQILFPPGVAAIYRGEHYPQLLAWLKSKSLIREELQFAITSRIVPGSGVLQQDVRGTLDLPFEMFALPALKIENHQPFFKRELGIQWSVRWQSTTPPDSVFMVRRDLGVLETARGETQKVMQTTVHLAQFEVPNVGKGEAVVFNAFPDPLFHNAALAKGIDAVIVVQRDTEPAENAKPTLTLADRVKAVRTHAGIRGYTPGAKMIYQSDGTLQWWQEPGAAQGASGTAAIESTEPGQPQLQEPGTKRPTNVASSGGSSVQTLEPAQTSGAEGTQIKVFALRNSKARDAERIINQLFARELQSVAADDRTNSLIVRGDPDTLNIILHILTRLDEQVASPAASTSSTTTSRASGSSTAPPAELAKRYEAKEGEAARLAKQIRELNTAPDAHKSALKDLDAQLRRAVSEAFQARQQLHQAELAQLQERAGAIQQSLKARQQISDQIIDRRVKDLINPDLQWDSAPLGQARSLAPRANGTSTNTSSSSSTAAPPWRPTTDKPNVTNGTYWGPEAEYVLKSLGLLTKKIESQDAPDGKHVGARRVTTRDPTSPAGIQAGDIITNMMTEGTPPNISQATLNIVRGDERLPPVTVDFPPRFGTASARALQDKLRERWEIMEPLYTNGRTSLESVLNAATEAAEGELVAATNEVERLAARKQLVERLKRIKAIVQAKFDNQVEPKQTMLSVEAALLKAELAAKPRPPVKTEPPITSGTRGAQSSSPSSTNTTSDDAAAMAYRDKLRERVQLLERQFKTGEMPLMEYQRAQIQLDDAEIAAAVNTIDRRTARQKKIDHLKDIVTAVQRLHRGGQATQTDLLAAEAELLKAEGELAGKEAGAEHATDQTSPEKPATISLPTSSGGQAVLMRSADEFRKELREAEDALSNAKAWMQGIDPSGKGTTYNQRERDSAAKALPSWERRLKWVRDQYDAQIHLLELEGKDAQSAIEARKQEYARLQSMVRINPRALSQEELAAARRTIEAAELRLERAQTLLDLYRKADPKNATPAQPAATIPTPPR